MIALAWQFRHLIGAVAIVLVLAGTYWWVTSVAYQRGWNDALTAVSAQNAVARRAADQVRDELDKCFDQGGSWDVTEGRCSTD